MLHIADGESVAGTLRETRLPGEVGIYGDLMYEGPCPAGLTGDAWRDVRAAFLAADDPAGIEEARQYFQSFDDTLAAASTHDETILWLDYHLTDQLILIKVLDWFGGRPERDKLSLIGVDRLLGSLRAVELAALAATRQQVSEAMIQLAASAWRAFTAPDPTAIEQVIAGDTSPLPFLSAALRRHLEQFPSVDGGLSRTDRQTLSVLRASGPLQFVELFCAVQELEDPLFMGDLSFLWMLNTLASARVPLIQGENADGLESGAISITGAGLAVLEGRDDHVRMNGIDRWLGGVHLAGVEAAWRWDPATRRLVSVTSRKA